MIFEGVLGRSKRSKKECILHPIVGNPRGSIQNFLYNLDMNSKRFNSARFLIGVVLLVNLQCALAFLWQPERYMGGFGLSGEIGQGMLRALGLLFLMWNVPYVFALWHPLKNFTSLVEAVIMQGIGLIGETVILMIGNYQNPLVDSSVKRFMLFDGGGLVLLIIALLVVQDQKRKTG